MGFVALDRWEEVDLYNEGLRLPEPDAVDYWVLPAWYVAQTLHRLEYGATVPYGVVASTPILGN